jgi:hypothetical protein
VAQKSNLPRAAQGIGVIGSTGRPFEFLTVMTTNAADGPYDLSAWSNRRNADRLQPTPFPRARRGACYARAATIGLVRRLQHADRHPLGRGRCRHHSQTRRGIGRGYAGRNIGYWGTAVGALQQATATEEVGPKIASVTFLTSRARGVHTSVSRARARGVTTAL